MDHILESLGKFERKSITIGINKVLTSLRGNGLGKETKNRICSLLSNLLSGNEIGIGRTTSNTLFSLIKLKRRELIIAIIELTCIREEAHCMQLADEVLTEIEGKIQGILVHRNLQPTRQISHNDNNSSQQNLEIFSLTDGSTLMISKEGTGYRVQVDDGAKLIQNYHCARYSIEGDNISIYDGLDDNDANWGYNINKSENH